jgi:hypothetical protein
LDDLRGSKALFLNPKRKLVVKLRVDPDEIALGKRCDGSLIYDDIDVYFIELKSGYAKGALEQLGATLDAYEARSCRKYHFRTLVVAGGPSSELQRISRVKEMSLFRKKHQYLKLVASFHPSKPFDLSAPPKDRG